MNIKNLAATAIIVGLLASCGGEQKSVEAPVETPIDQPMEAVAVTSGKYQIKSGIVTFDVEMLGMKSKKVLYFDDFGAKERVEQYDEDGALKEVSISDGEKRYTLIPAAKKAYFVDNNGNRGWEMEFTSWDKIQQQSNYQEDYKKAANMTIAGKDCESFTYGSTATFAGWNGVTLYHEQGKTSKVLANKLEEDVAIESDKFTVPADYSEVKLN